VPVITTLMLIGKSGSAMSAELGTMRVTEQIDAMETMSVNPIHYLVVPRVYASVLMFPMLTALANRCRGLRIFAAPYGPPYGWHRPTQSFPRRRGRPKVGSHWFAPVSRVEKTPQEYLSRLWMCSAASSSVTR
jgi:hypothetical protein